MSDLSSSYRLEAPRPRPVPPPLRLPAKEPPSRRASAHNLNESQTLLYDLPSPVGYASATSPPPGDVSSPTSPSVLRSRSRTPKSGRPTPPPGHRHRSATPAGAAPNDLEKFAEHCRAWCVIVSQSGRHTHTIILYACVHVLGAHALLMEYYCIGTMIRM
jgi:hypothetical protein